MPSIALAESSITIDGYYDDWADKPQTTVTYGGWNGLDVHNVSLFLDNGYLYGHIKMSDVDGHYDPTNVMNLIINDQYNLQFFIRKNNDNSGSGNVHKLPVGINLNLATFDNVGKKEYLGDTAITIYDKNHSEGDDIEFCIDLESARSFCENIPTDQMKSLTLNCPSLGSQEVTVTGTSTSPFLGIAISLAALGLLMFFGKKKLSV